MNETPERVARLIVASRHLRQHATIEGGRGSIGVEGKVVSEWMEAVDALTVGPLNPGEQKVAQPDIDAAAEEIVRKVRWPALLPHPKAVEVARAILLRFARAPEGRRIEGWVPNWDVPDGGAILRGVMKPVPLPDRGCEFYAGPKPFTQDTWTRATLIIYDATPTSSVVSTPGSREET